MKLHLAFASLFLILAACSSAPKSAPKKKFDKEGVRAPIRQNLKDVRKCYDEGLKRDPKMQGKVIIVWTIDGKGKATQLGIDTATSTLTDEKLVQCIHNHFRTWQFPIPPKNAEVEVKYPFIFALDKETKEATPSTKEAGATVTAPAAAAPAAPPP